MGFRVNKRIQICKGVTLNVGKKGISTSVKIGNTTINSKGRVSTRIAPGISYTTNLKGGKKQTEKNKPTFEERYYAQLEKDKAKREERIRKAQTREEQIRNMSPEEVEKRNKRKAIVKYIITAFVLYVIICGLIDMFII